MKNIVIGYFADGPWSHLAFEKIILNNQIKVAFICVRNDSSDQTLANYSKKQSIPLLRSSNINSTDFLDILRQFNCDLLVSMSFNQIFKQEIIELCPNKPINCHAGKLPFYRGRNILNWVLINNEDNFGVTVHYIDSGIDTGDIILQRTYPITDKDTYKTLLERAYVFCAETLYDAIVMFIQGNVPTVKQTEIHEFGFYCSARKVGDEYLDWNQNSRNIFNFVRAICSPGPKARSYISREEIKINKVELVEGAPEYIDKVGSVVGIVDGCFFVKTLDTVVKVIEYEFPKKIRIGNLLSKSILND